MGDDMKYISVSYKKYSKLYNLILLSISISITLGLVLSFCLDKNLINDIYNYFLDHVNNYNLNTFSNIIYPIIIYIGIFILSLTLIGSFIPLLVISIENISIGLILGIILRIKYLKGLLFGTVYFIITKLLYIILLFYIAINIYKFIRSFIDNIKTKQDISLYNLYSRIILKILFCILVITIYNILLMFVAPYIFNFLKILL